MIKKRAVKEGSAVKVTFALPGSHEALPASVVGEFNDWDPFAHPLKRRSNGTWSAAVELEAGSRYRFRYLGDGGVWFGDGDADELAGVGAEAQDCVILT